MVSRDLMPLRSDEEEREARIEAEKRIAVCMKRKT